MNTNPFFQYQARLVEVIDGDTLDLELDLGFQMTHHARVRLVGADTHEVYGVDADSEEAEKGRTEAAFVAEWLKMAERGYEGEDEWFLIASTLRDRTGKYGRYLADVFRRDTGASLTNAILTEFPEVAD